MARKTRTIWANSLLAGFSIAGGLLLTNHFAPFLNPASPGGGGTGSTAKNGTQTSDAIQYQYGQVQLSVTETNGKITAVSYANSTASAGRDAAFPYLVKDAISANGSSFGNLSGATFTTDAFKQALDNAIAKFG